MLHCSSPSVYHGVRAPGWRKDAMNGVAPGGGSRVPSSANLPRIEQGSQFVDLARHRPALLNNCDYTSFKLDDRIGSTEYCSSFSIDNVTVKSITLLGEKAAMLSDEDNEEAGVVGHKDDMYCQRVYRFSVEVWPAPEGSAFRHTKVIPTDKGDPDSQKNYRLSLSQTRGVKLHGRRRIPPWSDCTSAVLLGCVWAPVSQEKD